MFEEIFCHNMALLRKRHGLSRRDMARRLGIGPGSLRAIERGEVPPGLSMGVLQRVQEEFGLPPAEFLRDFLQN